ncbi:MAG: prepilin peptidase [Planctomycetota bacterium]
MPYDLAIIFIFGFGLMVGSFFNVCIYRLPREGLSVVKPRSFCPQCQNLIYWYDNIPVVSFLILRGRCRSCGATISWRYPLVEIMTALLFAGAGYLIFKTTADFTSFRHCLKFIIYIYLLGALIITTFIDFEFRIIPDEISLWGIVVGLVFSIIFPWWHPAAEGLTKIAALNGFIAALGGLGAGGGIIYLVRIIGKFVFKKEAMGLGDVKLMVFLGTFLGWRDIIWVFLLGCIFGSVFGIISWLITKDRYIAFGPFLALGAVAMMFFKEEIYYFIYNTYPNIMKDILLIQ